MKARWLVLPCVLVLWTALARAEEAAPFRPALSVNQIPQNEEMWYGLYVRGKKSGYFLLVTKKGGEHYVQRSEMRIMARSMGQQMDTTVASESRFQAAPPFAYVGGSTTISQPTGSQSKTATVKDGKIVVQVSEGGLERTIEQDAPDYTLADLLASRLWFQQPRKIGDKIDVRSFDLQNVKAFTTGLVVSAVETSTVQGVPVTYYTADVSTSTMGPLGPMRVTDKGDMISMSMMGMMEMRLEPEDVAKKIEEGGDLFFENTVKIDKPVGKRGAVRKLVLRARGKPDALARIRPGPRQTVTKNEDGTLSITLGAAGADIKATDEEIEENLKDEPEFPVSHELVQRLARLAVGDAKTDREKVTRLVGFVCGFVDDVLRPEPVSVLEVCASRRGDCQEHSILFTSLARAAGVPTRSVAGLAYLGDEMRAFGGHAWNEVVLDGHWVPVDATFNEAVIDAAHIRVGTGLRGLIEYGWTLGKIQLQLVSVESEPKAPEEPGK